MTSKNKDVKMTIHMTFSELGKQDQADLYYFLIQRKIGDVGGPEYQVLMDSRVNIPNDHGFFKSSEEATQYGNGFLENRDWAKVGPITGEVKIMEKPGDVVGSRRPFCRVYADHGRKDTDKYYFVILRSKGQGVALEQCDVLFDSRKNLTLHPGYYAAFEIAKEIGNNVLISTDWDKAMEHHWSKRRVNPIDDPRVRETPSQIPLDRVSHMASRVPDFSNHFDVLRQIYLDRRKNYKDNFLRFGPIMHQLFPQGLELKTPKDWIRIGLFIQMISKITRYAVHFKIGGHDDSLDDLAIYATMLEGTDQILRDDDLLDKILG